MDVPASSSKRGRRCTVRWGQMAIRSRYGISRLARSIVEVADYMLAHGYDLRAYAEKNWATIGPKLTRQNLYLGWRYG